jgi:hypothetical protein
MDVMNVFSGYERMTATRRVMGIKGLPLLMIKEEGLQVSVLGSERCSISQNGAREYTT